MTLPDPPICIDYSAQNDRWSVGHERFVRAMRDRRYALFFYWGPFGHANNSAKISEVNDLIDSFDWLSVKRNDPYPAFTNASTDSRLPWPDDLKRVDSGQINAFFRWETLRDTSETAEMKLFLVSPRDLNTRFEVPAVAHADVTLRRLQKFRLQPDTAFRWTFGAATGQRKTNAQGLITIPGLSITSDSTTLKIHAGGSKAPAASEPPRAPPCRWQGLAYRQGEARRPGANRACY